MRIFALLLPAAVLVAPDGTQGCGLTTTVVTAYVPDELPGTVVGPCLTEPSIERAPTTDTRTFDIHAACQVRAYRKDGALTIRSRAVWVTPNLRGRQYVELSLPSERVGGVGVRTRWTRGDGMRVRRRLVGSPAAEQLQDDDLIVAVDSLPTRGMSTWGFRDLMAGAPGTTVALEVERSGDTHEIVIERAFLPREEGPPPGLRSLCNGLD